MSQGRRPPPLGLQVALAAVYAIGFGIVFFVAVWDGPAYVAFVFAGILVLNIGLVVWRRRRLTRDYRPDHTGRTLSGSGALPMPASWVGGSTMAGRLGRTNATPPLAVLELSAGTLTLRLRPAPVAAFLGVPKLAAARDAVESIFPVQRGLTGRGVGILVEQTPVAYFWTRHPEEVLATAGAAGFPVSWQEQRARR